jgi:hypothetical protein
MTGAEDWNLNEICMWKAIKFHHLNSGVPKCPKNEEPLKILGARWMI